MNKLFAQTKYILLTLIILCSTNNISSALAASSYTTKNNHISYSDIGQGQPIILVHAFPTDRQLWVPQQEGLKKHFRIITLDLKGFGQSVPVNGQAITMTEYADEVAQLMDQLHIQKAVIGGESMGGYIALAFLEKYPHKVDGLILSDTQSIADTPEAKAKREATAVDVLEHGTDNLINGFMPKALSPKASELTKGFLRQILEAQKADGIASALRGMALRNDTSFLLANSTLPILIITGEEDTLILLQQNTNMHTLARNSKLVVLADAGHLSSLEQPKKWNQAVIDCFKDIKSMGNKNE